MDEATKFWQRMADRFRDGAARYEPCYYLVIEPPRAAPSEWFALTSARRERFVNAAADILVPGVGCVRDFIQSARVDSEGKEAPFWAAFVSRGEPDGWPTFCEAAATAIARLEAVGSNDVKFDYPAHAWMHLVGHYAASEMDPALTRRGGEMVLENDPGVLATIANPDEAPRAQFWRVTESIFLASQVAAEIMVRESAQEDPAENSEPKEHGVRAAASLEWVCKVCPELTPRPPREYSKEQWQYIRNHDCPFYTDVQVPAFATWKRYVRLGRQGQGATQATKRHGRPHGGSIVREDQV